MKVIKSNAQTKNINSRLESQNVYRFFHTKQLHIFQLLQFQRELCELVGS